VCWAPWKPATSAVKSRKNHCSTNGKSTTVHFPSSAVNTFRNPASDAASAPVELARSTDAEKQSQLKRLAAFQHSHAEQAAQLLERLRRTVIDNGNTFEVLMEAVRGCSLGEITHTLYDVGGR